MPSLNYDILVDIAREVSKDQSIAAKFGLTGKQCWKAVEEVASKSKKLKLFLYHEKYFEFGEVDPIYRFFYEKPYSEKLLQLFVNSVTEVYIKDYQFFNHPLHEKIVSMLSLSKNLVTIKCEKEIEWYSSFIEMVSSCSKTLKKLTTPMLYLSTSKTDKLDLEYLGFEVYKVSKSELPGSTWKASTLRIHLDCWLNQLGDLVVFGWQNYSVMKLIVYVDEYTILCSNKFCKVLKQIKDIFPSVEDVELQLDNYKCYVRVSEVEEPYNTIMEYLNKKRLPYKLKIDWSNTFTLTKITPEFIEKCKQRFCDFKFVDRTSDFGIEIGFEKFNIGDSKEVFMVYHFDEMQEAYFDPHNIF